MTTQIKPLIGVRFADGSSFSKYIDMISRFTLQAGFVFSENRLYQNITTLDVSQTKKSSTTKDYIHISLVAERRKLAEYVFNLNDGSSNDGSTNDDSQAAEESETGTAVSFNISDFKNVTSGIKAKNAFSMYIYPNDTHIFLQILSNITASSPDVSAIPSLSYLDIPFVNLPYPNGDDKPVCVIQSTDFAGKCKMLTKLKCPIRIYYRNNKIVFQAIQNGNSGTSITFGGESETAPSSASNPPETDPFTIGLNGLITYLNTKQLESSPAPKLIVFSDDYYIEVRYQYLKALAKLEPISQKGIITMYMYPSFPLKLVTNMGTSASITIHILESIIYIYEYIKLITFMSKTSARNRK